MTIGTEVKEVKEVLFGGETSDGIRVYNNAVEAETVEAPEKKKSNPSNSRTWRDNARDAFTSAVTKLRRPACCGVVFAVLLTVCILLGISFKRVSSTEYGISYSKYSKQLSDAAKSGGLFNGPPGFRFVKFPSLFITEDLQESTCVSRDGLRVKYLVSFQYQMPEPWLLPAVIKYRNFEGWATVVEFAGNSAVQHACSLFSITNFQNKRGVIQSAMEDNLRLKLEGQDGTGRDGVYAKAISLQLKNVDLPDEYRTSVSEKQQAQEDIALAKNQRVQETTKARTKLLSANEEAKKINNTAVTEADLLLTEANLKAVLAGRRGNKFYVSD